MVESGHGREVTSGNLSCCILGTDEGIRVSGIADNDHLDRIIISVPSPVDTLVVGLANSARAAPCDLKIRTLAARRSCTNTNNQPLPLSLSSHYGFSSISSYKANLSLHSFLSRHGSNEESVIDVSECILLVRHGFHT